MPFRRDNQSNLIFESAPVAPDNYVTRITLPSDGSFISAVGLQRNTGQTFELKCLPGPASSIFKIRFARFSLNTLQFLPTDDGKPFIEYHGGTGSPASNAGAAELQINYTGVPAHSPEGVAYSETKYGKIAVDITLREAAEPGWVEFDLAYACPPQLRNNASAEAWEATLIYPALNLDQTGLGQHLLLNSHGLLGKLTDLAASPGACSMPLQFAAIYLSDYSWNGEAIANGIALSANDEVGNYKELHYMNTPGQAATSVSLHLRQPMHLKNRQYVFSYDGQPAPSGSPNYRLSYEGADGFGGASMRYRLRAFHMEKPANAGAIDWQDVAELYRTLAKKRGFYRKHNATARAGGHAFSMNPHTIVCNYGLDGPIDPAAAPADVRNALELHPFFARPQTDMPDNGNLPLPALLTNLKSKFTLRDPFLLEAQIWGFEMGGFYRFIGGFPPITNVLAQDDTKFRRAMQALSGAGILPSVTTDILATNFERQRFRGHLRRDGNVWKPFITQPFPSKVTASPLKTCATTVLGDNNRIFIVDDCNPTITTLRNNWKIGPGANESRYAPPPSPRPKYDILTRFYGIERHRICPTREVQNLYIKDWLVRHLLSADQATNLGVRVLEFMKHRYEHFFCYDPNHIHIDPAPADKTYDNAIGFGSWYVERLRSIFTDIHTEGLLRSGKDFALTTEFVMPEVLAPFVDDYYEYDSSTLNIYHGDTRSLPTLPIRSVPLFHFIYNPIVGQKMNLADSDYVNHPGYTEQRTSTAALNLKMLASEMDALPVPPPPYDLDPNNQNARMASFIAWRQRAYDDFDGNGYAVRLPGLSPQEYPTTTGTYSYCRGKQDIFNLRSRIFRFGAAAVRGERILLPAAWIETPAEYNDEVLKMAVRAAQLHQVYRPFFKGDMMGQAEVSPSTQVWAWRANNRHFSDVLELVRDVGYTTEEIFGGPNTLPVGLVVTDTISRGHDVYEVLPVTPFRFAPTDFFNASAFLTKLLKSTDMVSQYLRPRFSANMTAEDMAAKLNEVLSDTALYDAQRFSAVTLREVTQRLVARRPRPDDLQRLNQLLIQDAYPRDIIKRGPLYTSTTILTDKVQHMIWRWTANASIGDVRYLYVFANVGNTPQAITFRYTTDISGPDAWVSIKRQFSGNPAINRDGKDGKPDTPELITGLPVAATIPERVIVAYGVLKQKFLP